MISTVGAALKVKLENSQFFLTVAFEMTEFQMDRLGVHMYYFTHHTFVLVYPSLYVSVRALYACVLILDLEVLHLNLQ